MNGIPAPKSQKAWGRPHARARTRDRLMLGSPHAAAEARRLARIWRAIMLAPSLEVCEALLRAESVPVDHLDAEWVKRFGMRR